MGWYFTRGTGDLRWKFDGGLLEGEALRSCSSSFKLLFELSKLELFPSLYGSFCAGWSKIKSLLLSLIPLLLLLCSAECFLNNFRSESTVSLSLPWPCKASIFFSSLVAALSRSWAWTFLNSSTISFSLGPGVAVALNLGVLERESSGPFFEDNISDSSRLTKLSLSSFCLFLFLEKLRLFCLEKSGFLLWPPVFAWQTKATPFEAHLSDPILNCEWNLQSMREEGDTVVALPETPEQGRHPPSTTPQPARKPRSMYIY